LAFRSVVFFKDTGLAMGVDHQWNSRHHTGPGYCHNCLIDRAGGGRGSSVEFPASYLPWLLS